MSKNTEETHASPDSVASFPTDYRSFFIYILWTYNNISFCTTNQNRHLPNTLIPVHYWKNLWTVVSKQQGLKNSYR